MPSLTASYTGFVNGDTPLSLTTQPSLTTTATAASDTGTYAITAAGAADPDYTITYAAGTLTITKAALTITADNQTKLYGAGLPTLTASYTGFVNGDTPASLDTGPTLATTATTTSNVGVYSISVSDAADIDYTISYVAGSLTVTSATLTITADNQTKLYGTALPTLTASYSGFVNGDSAASLTTQPTLTTNATDSSHVSGNPYSITASDAADSNYSISYGAGTLTVTPVALTITANNQTKVYGAALPVLTVSYTGFVNGDTSTSLTDQPTLSSGATASGNVSGNPYSITASGAVDSDYTISYVTGILTVTPAWLTITANNQTKVYGSPQPVLTASYAGFVNGDNPNSLDTQPTLSTTATIHSDTGSYAITASAAADPNYTINYVDGTLTVTQATLTVTADDQTRPQGQANPPLTYSFSGFVNGDTASVVSGAPILSTTATIASPDGQYPIAISVGSLTAVNYDFTEVGGILTVANTPATTITLTASPGSTSTYGQALTFTAIVSPTMLGNPTPTGTIQFEVDGNPIGVPVTLVNGSATSDSLTTLDAASHSIEAIYSGDAEYATNAQSLTQTVNPAPLTITADNQTKFYGAALPTLTASYSGFVNDDSSAGLTTQPTLATTATIHSGIGAYTIAASGAVDPNYTIAYVAGTLTVNPATVTVTANDLTRPPNEANPPLTYTLSGLVNGDTSSVITGAPVLSTTAIFASPPGQYPITVAVGTLSAANYNFTTVNGTLIVTASSAITIGPATLPVGTVGDGIQPAAHSLGRLGHRLPFRGLRAAARPVAEHIRTTYRHTDYRHWLAVRRGRNGDR